MSYGFPNDFLWIPFELLWDPNVFLVNYGILLNPLWVPNGIPDGFTMDVLWIPTGFLL